MNKKKKRSMIKTIIAAVVLATVCLLCAFVAYAYFSTRVYVYNANGEKEVAQIGMSLNLLFDKINSNEAKNQVPEGTDLGTGTPFDSTAEWGTAANPFIISEGRHLYNLSALQEIGYFYDLFINAPNETVPYFLVCDSDGTPQTIDGENMTISPIGTDTYPFRGYVGGAFIKKDENNNTITTTVKGNESDTSALCNVIVKTETDVIDVGLFGTVGYTGKDTNVKVDTTIENLVLCDVQVVVDEPNALDTFAGFMRDHFFSYDVLTEQSDIDSVPHENHHIGIFAGHIGYANVNYISVYYSDDSTMAIDLSHTKANYDGNKGANYASTTGIIGYMYNMNPGVDSSGMAVGGGISSNSLSMSNGVGSGGGLLSGLGRGYISAADIENAYGGSSARDADGNLLIKSAIDEEGNPLCQEWVEKISNRREYHYNRYYFHDGVFTFALSSTGDNDTIKDTWEKDGDTYKPDSFSIGADDDSAWKKNVDFGNYSLSAFLKPVTNMDQLKDIVDPENAASKKPLIVMYKDANGNVVEANLLTLTKNSGAITAARFGNDGSYTTFGTIVPFASSEDIESAIEGLNNTTQDKVSSTDWDRIVALKNSGAVLDTDSNGKYDSVADGIEVLNFATGNNADKIDELESIYNIDINYSGTNSKYYYFEDGTPAFINPSTSELRKSEVVDNYYYYTHTNNRILLTTYHTLNYRSSDGSLNTSSPLLNTNASWVPNGYTTADSTNGISRTMTRNNSNDKRPLIFYVEKDGKYYYKENGIEVSFDPSGQPIIPGDTSITDYLMYDILTDTYYIVTNKGKTSYSSSKVHISDVMGTDEQGNEVVISHNYTIDGVKKTYTSDNFIYAEQMDYFTFGGIDKNTGKNNLLRIIFMNNTGILGWGSSKAYSMWNGDDDTVKNANGSSSSAIVKFDENDGSCVIRYSFGNNIRYLNYNAIHSAADDSGQVNNMFNGTSNETLSTTKMYIYTLEGTAKIDYGQVTYDPRTEAVDAKDATSTSAAINFNAAEYVLWPNQIEAGATAINSPTYSIKSLKELAGEDATTGLPTTGWKNKAGQTLSVADLNKKFHMSSKINWTALQNSNYAINLWGFTIATEGFIKAPIGSNGDMANIPQGTVAFKINKPGESKIRVIVAVPQQDYAIYEDGHIDLEETYFALWKTDLAEQGFIQRFNRNNSIAKFKVPISEPYAPNSTAGSVEHFTVNYNNNTYRMYMNGDRLLVAYEFTVNEEGVYVLGTTGAPMEIVYFSADGTASAGRDGTSGSMIGSIDFVYDYDGNIVTVKEKSSVTEPEDYHDYYATLCLLYTDNAKNSSTAENQYKFTDINNAQIKVRRFVADGKSQLNFDVDGQKDYVQFLRYAVLSDQINDKRQ